LQAMRAKGCFATSDFLPPLFDIFPSGTSASSSARSRLLSPCRFVRDHRASLGTLAPALQQPSNPATQQVTRRDGSSAPSVPPGLGWCDRSGLQVRELSHTPSYVWIRTELGFKECGDDVVRNCAPYYPGANARDVCIVMLDALPGHKRVVDDGCSDSAHLVGGDSGAHPGSTHQ
jgi:hypothetical protein